MNYEYNITKRLNKTHKKENNNITLLNYITKHKTKLLHTKQ